MNHRKTVFAIVFTSILSIVLLSSFVLRLKELKPGCLTALNSAGIHTNKKNEAVKITQIDLASDTVWMLSCDGGPARPIKVPGGGWNSDQQMPRIQEMRDVKDFVIYERKITIPVLSQEQAVRIKFGEKKTAEVAVGWDYPDVNDSASCAEANTWAGWHGNSKIGYGIVRSADLAILPAIHVGEVFVHPSVSRRELTCEVWLRNTTDKVGAVSTGATLSSWNKRVWEYPEIPAVTATIPAHGETKVVLGPVTWTPGTESYWWPNIPFQEEYQAQLHYLNLNLTEAGKLWHTTETRFGFVEHAEGPYYYTVNSLRVTGLSDGTPEGGLDAYDSYGSAAAFLPPTQPGTGYPETWRRYMRIGININRLYCSAPTEYMMEVADETGFMLIPEAPIWGNSLSRYNPAYTPQTYHDLARHCRSHPCVARYSLANEVREPREKMKDAWPWRSAIDDIRTVDDKHPLTFELHAQGQGRVEGQQGGHAWVMNHYADIFERVGEGKGIRGMGEHFWERNSMGEFAVGVRTLRLNDWCYMAGWCWINYWPNFLEGMSHDRHAWKPQNHPDRKDNIDGWNSPIVAFTQRSLHPHLVQDIELLKENPGDPKELVQGKIEWPYLLPTLIAGQPVERKIEVFNGGLSGNQLTLRWSTHWDSPVGPEAAIGGEIPSTIEPGFHATQTINFTIPKIEQDSRQLYLILESLLDGKPVFRSEETCLKVVTIPSNPL